jgi:ADP-heptose:LPS heptosyltransferase
MGSIVLAYPAIAQLKIMYPNAKLYFLTFKQIEDGIKIFDIIPKENIFTIDSNSTLSLIKDTITFIKMSRKKQIDTAISFEMFARYSIILSYLSGAKRRVGFFKYYQEGLYIGDLLSHKVSYNPHIHTAYSFIALVLSLQFSKEVTPLTKFKIDKELIKIPKIYSKEADIQHIWNKLKSINGEVNSSKKLIIVNPNASKLISIRRWPLDNYISLVRKLIDNEDIYIPIIGLMSEREDAQYICDHIKNARVLDLTGKTSLNELIHLFNIGNILITNDSGPAHFASLTDIHTAVFFGPETPSLYGPLSANHTIFYSHYACSPCVSAYNQRLSPCKDNVCLKVINPDHVYHVICDILLKKNSKVPVHSLSSLRQS